MEIKAKVKAETQSLYSRSYFLLFRCPIEYLVPLNLSSRFEFWVAWCWRLEKKFEWHLWNSSQYIMGICTHWLELLTRSKYFEIWLWDVFIPDLICCSRVSKRMRNICLEESLWSWDTINLCLKRIPAEVLGLILSNGCKYLSLSR